MYGISYGDQTILVKKALRYPNDCALIVSAAESTTTNLQQKFSGYKSNKTRIQQPQ
jgi:hypothetical protein